MPTAVWPIVGVFDETVMHRVVMNISNQPAEIFTRINEFSFKAWNEWAPFPVVFFIIGFGVGVKKIAKLLTDYVAKTSKVLKTLRFGSRFLSRMNFNTSSSSSFILTMK